jgi:hypothetical protein
MASRNNSQERSKPRENLGANLDVANLAAKVGRPEFEDSQPAAAQAEESQDDAFQDAETADIQKLIKELNQAANSALQQEQTASAADCLAKAEELLEVPEMMKCSR